VWVNATPLFAIDGFLVDKAAQLNGNTKEKPRMSGAFYPDEISGFLATKGSSDR